MFYLIIWLAKLVGGLSRLFGRGGGSALPGLIAEKSDPKILAQLGSRLPQGSIVITGTNGKTTTTKMVAEVLAATGQSAITNRSGSNLSRGIVSTLIESIGWSGRFRADIGLFEVDEASMPAVCEALQPKAVVVLNLFRDQLDRYGELDTTAALIGRAIATLDTQLYLSADDPLVASLSRYVSNVPGQMSKVHYFGVDRVEETKLAHDLAADSNHCPFDGSPLIYDRTFFGHIGHYRCPQGDFKRPQPQTELKHYQFAKQFELRVNDQTAKFSLPLPGLYNAYNALAAVSLCDGLGIELKVVVGALERVTAAFGRVERLEIDGRVVLLLLIKNPTGFNQVIQTFLTGVKPTSLLVAINDNFADGRDVSWLWDVAIEEILAGPITVSGTRALDMALRFKYIDRPVRVIPDLKQAFSETITRADEGEMVYVLPTYTAMLELRQHIKALGLVKGNWE